MPAAREEGNEPEEAPSAEPDGSGTVAAVVGPTTVIQAKLNDVKVRCLIDTGATISLVDLSTCKQVGGWLNEGEKSQFRGFDLGKGSGIGMTTLKVRLGHVETNWEFHVVERMTEPVIIGTDLMSQIPIRPDVRRGVVEIDGRLSPLIATTKALEVAQIRIDETITVPGRSQQLVKVSLQGAERGVSYVMEPNEEFVRKYHVVPARGFGTGEVTEIMVLNPHVHPTKLYKGSAIGRAEPFVEDGKYVMVVTETMTSTELVCDPAPSPWSDEQMGSKIAEMKLDSEGKRRFAEFLQKNRDVFAVNPKNPGLAKVPPHRINTKGTTPFKMHSYRNSRKEKELIEGEVQTMLKNGIIQPSESPWSSPPLLVGKKDGDLRFCVDYRRLNSVTEKDSYPLPRIDETLEALSGATVFTSLDLAAGYWQIPIAEEDRPKTAFVAQSGLYEYNVLPFGLSNGPATFQRTMDIVLSGLNFDSCLVYIDDIIVFSRDLEKHFERLTAIFQRLRGAGLHLKFSKCSFAQAELEFLGHKISSSGIHVTDDKVRAVKELPVPTNLEEVRRFLGMAGYYRRFIEKFSQKALPLTNLTKKDIRFVWAPDCQTAFERLKSELMSAPILAFPDFTLPFILYADASKMGLGATLSQVQEDKERVIAYASRTTNKHERNYSITELECLGVVWATKEFRPYLHGRPFTIVTDHQALTWMHSQKEPQGRVGRWVIKMMEFDYTVKYKPGKEHSNVDTLSRAPIGTVAVAEREVEVADFAADQRADPWLGAMIRYLENQELPETAEETKTVVKLAPFFVIDGTRLWHVPNIRRREANDRLLCIPANRREDILYDLHNDILGGHLGEAKTLEKVRCRYWWPHMWRDVKRWVSTCASCEGRKAPRMKVPGQLQPIRVTERWDTVGVDFVGPLPKTQNGNKYLVVFCDYMTKWPEVFAIPVADAKTVARLLFDEVVCRYGAPRSLISDRGKQFKSALVMELCALCSIKKVFTSAYHPQTDGEVERFNHTLVTMLSMYCSAKQDDWDRAIPAVLFAYRTSSHASSKHSPAFLMFGRTPQYPVDVALRLHPKVEAVERVRQDLVLALETARGATGAAQERQKQEYDRRRRNFSFQTGDWVRWFRPFRHRGLVAKLRLQWAGPYRIAQVLNDGLTYRLRTMTGFLVKERVNVTKLKKAHPPGVGTLEQPADEPVEEGYESGEVMEDDLSPSSGSDASSYSDSDERPSSL